MSFLSESCDICPESMAMVNVIHVKGQLISECLLGVIDIPKNNLKFDKSGQINKVKAPFYNNMIYI